MKHVLFNMKKFNAGFLTRLAEGNRISEFSFVFLIFDVVCSFICTFHVLRSTQVPV